MLSGFRGACRRRLAAAACLALGALACPVLAPSHARAQPLEAQPASLDFGTLKPGASASLQLRLRNPGSSAADVQLQVSGRGFAVAADTLRIAGAGDRRLTVRFSAPDTGRYAGELTLQVRELFGSERLVVPLAAAVERPLLSVRPNPQLGIDFERADAGTVARRPLEVSNPGRVELRVDSLSVGARDGEFSVAGALPERLAPGARAAVDVLFAPRVDGVAAGHLRIHSRDLAGRVLAIPLRGEGLAPALAVSPLPQVGIDFERVEVGDTGRRVLSLLNTGRADLRVRLQLEEELFANDLDSAAVEPGARRDVEILYRPRYEGPASGRLVLHSNDPAHPRQELALTGRALVSPPRVELLDRSPVAFGSVPIGKLARQQLLMWNRGGSPYTVRLELEDGGDPEFGLETGAVLLHPGESGKVGLSFRPKEIGDREAVLFVDTEAGRRRYELRGTGQFLQLSPSTFDFGRVPVGESSSGVVDLVNTGNADFTISRIQSSSDDFTVYTQVGPDSKFLLPANSLRSLPVSVSFAPTRRGLSTGTLRLEGFWEEGTETLEVLLNGTGVAAEIELHPSGPLDFGYVVLGDSDQRNLVATNSGDTALKVAANPLTREAHVEPDSFSLEPGQSTTLRIHFTPLALGDRFAQILLISNDVSDKAQPIKIRGHGALESIDLAPVVSVSASRKSGETRLRVPWNNNPLVVRDGTKVDLRLQIPDSLRQALVGRRVDVEWVALDANYDPKGSATLTKVQIYEDSEGSVLVEDLNLRLTEAGTKRVRLRLTTRSYPDAPPQSISQVLEAGGWKWEFEAKPLVSFLTIRPGRDWTDRDGNRVVGKTERLIGLPGIAFAGWHNAEHPAVSGVHLTAIGNVLEALSTDNSIAVSLGLAVSLYKDRFLFGFGWDIYDSRPRTKRKGTQDYILTFKYSGLF